MPATIGKPAPDFAAKAVMPDGSFKDVKLSDYKGALTEGQGRMARTHAPARCGPERARARAQQLRVAASRRCGE